MPPYAAGNLAGAGGQFLQGKAQGKLHKKGVEARQMELRQRKGLALMDWASKAESLDPRQRDETYAMGLRYAFGEESGKSGGEPKTGWGKVWSGVGKALGFGGRKKVEDDEAEMQVARIMLGGSPKAEQQPQGQAGGGYEGFGSFRQPEPQSQGYQGGQSALLGLSQQPGAGYKSRFFGPTQEELSKRRREALRQGIGGLRQYISDNGYKTVEDLMADPKGQSIVESVALLASDSQVKEFDTPEEIFEIVGLQGTQKPKSRLEDRLSELQLGRIDGTNSEAEDALLDSYLDKRRGKQAYEDRTYELMAKDAAGTLGDPEALELKRRRELEEDMRKRSSPAPYFSVQKGREPGGTKTILYSHNARTGRLEPIRLPSGDFVEVPPTLSNSDLIQRNLFEEEKFSALGMLLALSAGKITVEEADSYSRLIPPGSPGLEQLNAEIDKQMGRETVPRDPYRQ